MENKKAIYAGTFDPTTNGHVWMIKRGAELFDELIVAIGENTEKEHAFSLKEREGMLKETVSPFPNVRVEVFKNKFVVEHAKSLGAQYVLRGIRSTQDYEYERAMRHVNGDLVPDITTVFLMAPRELVEISSSFVKAMVGPDGWEEVVKRYVPEPVRRKFLEREKK